MAWMMQREGNDVRKGTVNQPMVHTYNGGSTAAAEGHHPSVVSRGASAHLEVYIIKWRVT